MKTPDAANLPEFGAADGPPATDDEKRRTAEADWHREQTDRAIVRGVAARKIREGRSQEADGAAETDKSPRALPPDASAAFNPAADAEIPDVHDDPSWSPESAARFGFAAPTRIRGWWPPSLRRALYSWQQTCDAQEMELAALRGIVAQAQATVDSFDRHPTEGCVRDVVGLAESLKRYRAMRGDSPKPSLPHVSQSRSAA